VSSNQQPDSKISKRMKTTCISNDVLLSPLLAPWDPWSESFDNKVIPLSLLSPRASR
jgi:hypothetical protein